MSASKTIAIIGSGFSSLSAAAFLAQAGYKVNVFEKNDCIGGRARVFETSGFKFDMGPSWYWMPDVFERFFRQFNKNVTDYYQLDRLDPSYRVVFNTENKDFIDLPANFEELCKLFDSIELGAGEKLKIFLNEAQLKYDVGINNLVHKPSLSLMEFIDWEVISGAFQCDLFTSMRDHVAKYFRSPKLKQLMEFPVLFLGATAANTPSLYSMMNYADIKLGTWYPQGGMHSIIRGMAKLCEELEVVIHPNSNIKQILVSQNHNETNRNLAQGLLVEDISNQTTYKFDADVIVSGADYHHTETALLAPKLQSYNNKYWDTRVMAPSSMLYYLGIDTKIDKLPHHCLFFDESLDEHAIEIYEKPTWPSKPLFYTCCPSKTDKSVAPEGKENLFILIPTAPGLKGDNEELREQYLNQCLIRLENHTGINIKNKIIYKRSFAHREFIDDYNAFKGNAYGLANTLSQTAIFKPSLKSKKVENLFYTGQLTTPGPGMPPSLISGEVVAKEIIKCY